MAKKARPQKKNKPQNKTRKDDEKFLATAMIIGAFFIFASFVYVDSKNILGIFGEITARSFYYALGKVSYAIPFIIVFFAVNIIRKEEKYNQPRVLLGTALLFAVTAIYTALAVKGLGGEFFEMEKVKNAAGMEKELKILGKYSFYTAGIAGNAMASALSSLFSTAGAYIINTLLLMLSLVLFGKEQVVFEIIRMAGEFLVKLAKLTAGGVKIIAGAIAEAVERNKAGQKTKKKKAEPEEKGKEEKEDDDKEDDDEKPVKEGVKKPGKVRITRHETAVKKNAAVTRTIVKGDYTLPPTDLLKTEKTEAAGEEKDYAEDAERLKKTLNDFGIEANVVNVVDGPVISRFEIELATGVKVSRVENLAADIALAMRVELVRIAPVAGKSLLGIEVPKTKKQTIYLRDLIEDEQFQASESLLTLAIGRDLGGKPIIANLPDMPHLLIAGATGSGKSVCINNIIMSVLYKASPDEVKLLLVDPKKVELSNYNEIPHLIAPVITDPKHAAYILRRLVAEMKSRYDILAEEGAQNIEIFNARVKNYNEEIKKDKDVTPEDYKQSLPYIVLIIDELADLMTLAKSTVEESLQRLAQLARAVGIHIILATQRPSVDVITGVIKANFPSRIAFKVKSQVDSRTILDTKGAEALLGKGDMLYGPANIVKPIRGQAAFVRDEIPKVVNFVNKQRKPEISKEFEIRDEDVNAINALSGGGGDDGEDADILERACALAKEKGKVSTSFLQRKLGIGYSKAARLIDMMEEKGLITGADGNKPREWRGE